MNIKDDPARVAGEGELPSDHAVAPRPVSDADKELERELSDLVPGIHDMVEVAPEFTFLPAASMLDDKSQHSEEDEFCTHCKGSGESKGIYILNSRG